MWFKWIKELRGAACWIKKKQILFCLYFKNKKLQDPLTPPHRHTRLQAVGWLCLLVSWPVIVMWLQSFPCRHLLFNGLKPRAKITICRAPNGTKMSCWRINKSKSPVTLAITHPATLHNALVIWNLFHFMRNCKLHLFFSNYVYSGTESDISVHRPFTSDVESTFWTILCFPCMWSCIVSPCMFISLKHVHVEHKVCKGWTFCIWQIWLRLVIIHSDSSINTVAKFLFITIYVDALSMSSAWAASTEARRTALSVRFLSSLRVTVATP